MMQQENSGLFNLQGLPGAQNPTTWCMHPGWGGVQAFAPTHSLLSSPRSVSLIECGPVRTPFYEKMEGGPGGSLGEADVETRELFSRYQRHCERMYREEAQEPDEVVEVGTERLPGSQGEPRGHQSPRPSRARSGHPLPLLQVFLAALRDPHPALRYFSTERYLPLLRLRLDDPSGRSFVSAMHGGIFHQQQEGLDGAGSEAGARPQGP